jgi:hypothetical protein
LGTAQLYILDKKCVKLTQQLVLNPHHYTREEDEKFCHGQGGREVGGGGGGGGGERGRRRSMRIELAKQAEIMNGL